MNFFSGLEFNTIRWEALKGIPPETFWLIFAGLSFFLIFSLYQSYKIIIKARTIEDTPTSKIRSAAQGWVELEGKQRFYTDMPLIAPLSKTPCTWYIYKVEYYKKGGWTVVEQGMSESLLLLDDGTGQCIIDPKGANIRPEIKDSWTGFQRHPNGKPKSWIGQLWGSFGNYRYQEYRMENNTQLYAIGYFKTLPLAEAPDIIRNTYQPSANNDTVNILTQETANARQPYVLSAQTQKQMVQKIKKEGLMWIVTYLALFGVLSLLFIARML